MTSGTRLPTWKERENNKRRERRRRAIAAKIFAGLRMYGNFKLPKHCDNNEVLKALCNEAGWTVEPDGTTYRKNMDQLCHRSRLKDQEILNKYQYMPLVGNMGITMDEEFLLTAHFPVWEGCKPVERMDIVGGSATASPCSSYRPSPCASYNPSPASSSFPSPASSSYAANTNADSNSLIPWLKNLSSASSSASSSKFPNLYIHGGSISAPVTPPLSSPTARTPRMKANWDDQSARPSWGGQHYSFLPSSTPPSPGRQILPDPEWFARIGIPQAGPNSPTFSLVSSNPFGFKEEALAGGGSHGGSRGGSCMWTPGQSGTCSPAIAAGFDNTADVPMSEVISDEFAFGSNATGLLKPSEGEDS
ncbi:BES1/BZR1 homolog protein 4 isoform X1 [Hevea brasiliensis]|uniref:BES1/BZR1 homolog protein 4 isoform X1 n=1 Tax=Hevea brasiliensis TaxID=3981 RepID=UPI0025FE0436|nr:BES1/BZR1 homolog protein 4 isoform X1 [Hevea brasiliensis]